MSASAQPLNTDHLARYFMTVDNSAHRMLFRVGTHIFPNFIFKDHPNVHASSCTPGAPSSRRRKVFAATVCSKLSPPEIRTKASVAWEAACYLLHALHTVEIAPFEVHPQSANISSNHDYVIHCVAGKSTPSPILHWERNGEKFTGGQQRIGLLCLLEF